MAFKRSAVRSRLSPPKSLEIVRFRDFFFAKMQVLPRFLSIYKLVAEMILFAEISVPELYQKRNVLFVQI